MIENRLGHAGPLPEVDYLAHAGSNRSGALDIRSHRDSPPRESTLPASIDLPYLAVERIEAGDPVPARLAHFFQGGPTMGGMRPKAVIHDGARQYVAKFPSSSDRRFNVPAVEYATLVLARECGLDVSDTRLIRIDGERAAMLQPAESGRARRHMVSGFRAHDAGGPNRNPCTRAMKPSSVYSAHAARLPTWRAIGYDATGLTDANSSVNRIQPSPVHQ